MIHSSYQEMSVVSYLANNGLMIRHDAQKTVSEARYRTFDPETQEDLDTVATKGWQPGIRVTVEHGKIPRKKKAEKITIFREKAPAPLPATPANETRIASKFSDFIVHVEVRLGQTVMWFNPSWKASNPIGELHPEESEFLTKNMGLLGGFQVSPTCYAFIEVRSVIATYKSFERRGCLSNDDFSAVIMENL